MQWQMDIYKRQMEFQLYKQLHFVAAYVIIMYVGNIDIQTKKENALYCRKCSGMRSGVFMTHVYSISFNIFMSRSETYPI